MASLPSQRPRPAADPLPGYLCDATVLILPGWGRYMSFQRMVKQIREQLKTTNGILNYVLKADFLRLRFYTLTAWADRHSRNAFVRTGVHAEAVGRALEWVGPGSAFAEWTSPSPALDWPEARRRLKD